MAIVVNLKKYPSTIGGIRFKTGIFEYPDEQIEQAKNSPLGDGAQLGGPLMPIFPSLAEVESNFPLDDLLALIQLSIDTARVEGGSMVYAEQKLREFWKGFRREEVKKFLLDVKRKMETGSRASKFAEYEGAERYEITL